jgi:Tol biopolymer transport system component
MLALVTAVALLAADSEPAKLMMEAARKKEVVDGDLNGAIQQYSAIVSKFKSDRAVTAMALVRMAECYQKMGDAEARKIYEQVVKDYGDQKDAVALARARLGGPGDSTHQANRLLWNGDFSVGGSVSPDGRYFSYGGSDLFIHDTTTGAERRITARAKDSDDHADHSAISRDGKLVAYTWHTHNRYAVWVAGISGDPSPKRLWDASDDTEVQVDDWSPDGKWIAVQIYRNHVARIGLLSTADGALREVKTIDYGGPDRLFYSPDGKYLAYDLGVKGAGWRRLVVLSIANGAEVQGPAHRGEDLVAGWSPDGSRLLFTRDVSADSRGLWSIDFRNGRFEGQAQLLRPNLGHIASLGVSRSGALYYYPWNDVSDMHGLNVEVASLDFGSGKLLAPPQDEEPDSHEPIMSPAWSPDGKYLGYIAVRNEERPMENLFLRIRSAESAAIVREIPLKLTNFGMFTWAPDGRSVVGPGWDPKGQRGIYRVELETGETTPLVTWPGGARNAWYPTLSPDQTALYYYLAAENGTKSIIRRVLATGQETTLIERTTLSRVLLSPDGKYIAFSTEDPASNSRMALAVPTEGGHPREIMRVAAEVDLAQVKGVAGLLTGQHAFPAAWMPDSSGLIIRKRLSDAHAQDELWLVPLGGGEPRKLEVHLDRDRLMGVPALSVRSGGQQIAFMVNNNVRPWTSDSVWILENFLPPTK